LLDHREVVRDKEGAKAELALQIGQEIDHLRCTETSRAETGSSADDRARASGYDDPLTLAPGQLGRVAMERLGAQAHLESELSTRSSSSWPPDAPKLASGSPKCRRSFAGNRRASITGRLT
jgi:hypothetical protein